jgi:hypothetical protein
MSESKKNDWNPHFERRHKEHTPTPPARRQWRSRYHALVALLCFAFAVGVTGDVRWLKASPYIPEQPGLRSQSRLPLRLRVCGR